MILNTKIARQIWPDGALWGNALWLAVELAVEGFFEATLKLLHAKLAVLGGGNVLHSPFMHDPKPQGPRCIHVFKEVQLGRVQEP